jgi:hypothetical protein
MAIKIYNNKIEIGNYTLQETTGGLIFDGVVESPKFRLEQIFQGTNAGFVSGGGSVVNTIDFFLFSVDSNAVDHGDLTVARQGPSGVSSSVEGYTSGGYVPPGALQNVIDKFPFATKSNATDVGDLFNPRYESAGQSSIIAGYISGGFAAPGFTASNAIEKFFFASNNNLAYDVGDISVSRGSVTGCSSNTNGYTVGGETALHTTNSNVIDKFPFAGDSYATDVGDLTTARGRGAGQSSTTHGYISGGGLFPSTPTYTNNINKFLFASDSNATSVGTLTQARVIPAGQSSTVSGYTSGGRSVPTAAVTTIDKFPFATDSNATSVGSLTQARFDIAGHQY